MIYYGKLDDYYMLKKDTIQEKIIYKDMNFSCSDISILSNTTIYLTCYNSDSMLSLDG